VGRGVGRGMGRDVGMEWHTVQPVPVEQASGGSHAAWTPRPPLLALHTDVGREVGLSADTGLASLSDKLH
jgi:hypothetical protein